MYWIRTSIKQPALKSRAIDTIFKGETNTFLTATGGSMWYVRK